MKCVRNRCIKRLKHYDVARRFADSYSPDEYGTGEDALIDEIVKFAVHNLTGQEFRIFDFRFTDGLSYDEIASLEGISKVAVWKHLSRLLSIIRNNFNSSGK